MAAAAATSSSGGGDDERQPWGRFTCVSKSPAFEADHFYFSQRRHVIGRERRFADLVLESGYISKRHCEITLSDAEEDGAQPIVRLLDLSFNGVYVNEAKVGKGNSVVLQPNFTVHFTRPGIRNKGLEPLVFRFELLPNGLSRHQQPAPRPKSAESAASDLPATQAMPAPAAPSPLRRTQEMETAAARGAKKRAAAANLDGSDAQPSEPAEPRPAVALKKMRLDGEDAVATPARELPPTQAVSPSGSFLRPVATAAQAFGETVSIGVDATGIARGDRPESAHGSRQAGGAVGAGEGDSDASSRLQELNRELQEKLQEAENRVGQLTKQMSDTEQELLTATDKLDKCHEHGKQLEDELNLKRAELEARNNTFAQLTQERLEMKRSLEEATKRSERKDAELSDAKHWNKALSDELAKAKDALRIAEKNAAAAAGQEAAARQPTEGHAANGIGEQVTDQFGEASQLYSEEPETPEVANSVEVSAPEHPEPQREQQQLAEQPASSSSQDADSSEAHSALSIQGTPTDQHRHDSDESVLSGHSSSKTPPTKPRLMATRAAAAAPLDSVDIVVVDEDEEEEKETERVEPAESSSAAVSSGGDKDDPVGEAHDEEHEEKSNAAATEPAAAVANDRADDSKEQDGGEKQGGESAAVDGVASAGADEQQQPPTRWLPTLTHDEGVGSQANETSIFDDETQLSQ